MWNRFVSQTFSYVERMDSTAYLMIAGAAILIGVLCLRGFSSDIG